MPRSFLWLLLLLLPLTACAQAPAGPPVAGEDYEVLDKGQRWQAPNGKIEVVEVFAYWCPHCASFQPSVDAWKKKMPAKVSFVYVPAAFDKEDAYGKAFFAAESVKAVAKIHQPLFDAIHEAGELPRSDPHGGRDRNLVRPARSEPGQDGWPDAIEGGGGADGPAPAPFRRRQPRR